MYYYIFRLEPSLPLEGALAKNNILDDVERVLDGKIVGPESIASRKPEEIFVSLHGGKILRIWGPRYDHFKVVASIGPGCGEDLLYFYFLFPSGPAGRKFKSNHQCTQVCFHILLMVQLAIGYTVLHLPPVPRHIMPD